MEEFGGHRVFESTDNSQPSLEMALSFLPEANPESRRSVGSGFLLYQLTCHVSDSYWIRWDFNRPSRSLAFIKLTTAIPATYEQLQINAVNILELCWGPYSNNVESSERSSSGDFRRNSLEKRLPGERSGVRVERAIDLEFEAMRGKSWLQIRIIFRKELGLRICKERAQDPFPGNVKRLLHKFLFPEKLLSNQVT